MRLFKKIFFLLTLLLIIVVACQDYKKDNSIALTRGEVSIYVDETLYPILVEQQEVFQSQYNEAKIKLITLPEIEISKRILEGKVDFAVLARPYNNQELEYCKIKKHLPKKTGLAYDAIAIVANKQNPINAINESEIKSLFLDKSDHSFNYVLDNANSSTLNFLKEKYNTISNPKNLTALKSNSAVLDFVSKNNNDIGFVGVNWVTFPEGYEAPEMKNVKIIAVKNSDGEDVFPSQSDISIKKYPFTRTIYMLNVKGKKGLGMGFASFIAGEVGQRIILKAGLVPFEMPTRKIRIRKKI